MKRGFNARSSLSIVGFSKRFLSSNKNDLGNLIGSQPIGAPLSKKVTLQDIANKYKRKQKITMTTAYSFPSAVHVDASGIDILLCGDSLGMVELVGIFVHRIYIRTYAMFIF